MSTRWAAHRLENNYITEVPSQDQVLSPHHAPQCEGPALRGGTPEHLALKVSGDRVQQWSSTGLGETESTLGGHRQGFVHPGSQPRVVNSTGAGTGPPVGPRGSPVATGVGCGSRGRGKGKDSGSRSPPENADLSQRSTFWLQDLALTDDPHLQCWNASEQSAGYEHRPTHQQPD